METKANNYAAAASENLLKDALKAAYIQGYMDGQKDTKPAKAEPIIVDGIEYLDLGLPSGTLWAKDYVKEDTCILFLTSDDAQSYNIPTEEQFKELIENCSIVAKTHNTYSSLTIVGLNGVYFTMYSQGFKLGNETKYTKYFELPFKDPKVIDNKVQVYTFYDDKISIDDEFMGSRFPILTVK